MKLTVLCDNNTLIDRYYLGEPALSFLVEDEGKKILFDTGYSDVFMINAEAMDIDLNEVDAVVLSHGHNDHTGGLQFLDELECPLYCHPECDRHKEYQGTDISMPVSLEELNFEVHRTINPVKVSEHLTFLGEIPRKAQTVSPLETDWLYDDSAMVYEAEKGLFVITGCSHSGIINICEYARALFDDKPIISVIGGFHIQGDPALAREAGAYFARQGIKVLFPCHCTDLQAKAILAKYVPVREVGVGLTVTVDSQS